MDKSSTYYDDSSNSIIPPDGSVNVPRASELEYAYRYEIDRNQANKIILTGYFCVIFAVFISNLVFGLSSSPDGIALAVGFVLLA